MTVERKIPVIILTGGLGAGKTTLMNHILASRSDMRFAIIENEFGEIGIDQDLIDQTGEPSVVEVSDGCICCTVRNDLVKALFEIYERKEDFDTLIIETTGLAEPGPVAQVLIAEPGLTDKFQLNAVVSLVDAEYVLKQLGMGNITELQIGFADILVLNKIDRVDEESIQKILSRLTGINAQATILLSEHSKIDVETILTADGYSLERALELDPSFLEREEQNGSPSLFPGLLDRLPSYQDEISSVGIVLPGDLDEQKLECWLTFLTSFQSDDILRMKGILSISGMEDRFVIQTVHSTLTGDSATPWGNAVRESRLLIIGRFLDRAVLEDGLKNCLV